MPFHQQSRVCTRYTHRTAEWIVSCSCPNPACACAEGKSKDQAHKKWTMASTIAGHAAALAQAVLSKHGKCFDSLRQGGCSEELRTVDAEKSLVVAEYVLQARKIEALEAEVHVHPRS